MYVCFLVTNAHKSGVAVDLIVMRFYPISGVLVFGLGSMLFGWMGVVHFRAYRLVKLEKGVVTVRPTVY